MVMAAERAATMATTIHRICRNVGQPCVVTRAASKAPTSAKGNAKTECSNLIISSTVPMRPAIIRYDSDFRAAALPVQRYIFSCGSPACTRTRQTYCVRISSIVFGLK